MKKHPPGFNANFSGHRAKNFMIAFAFSSLPPVEITARE